MKKRLRLIAALALAFCLISTITAVSAFADYSQTYEVGQVIGKTEVYTADTKILSSSPNSGSLPGGVLLSNDDYRFYISGSPQSAGNYECSYWVQTEAGWASFMMKLTVTVPATATPAPTVAPTAAPTPTPTATANPTAAPKITKHPTGETVDAGGSAMFISRADNATQIVWRIVSADTTNTVLASEASDYFNGLTVGGIGTDTLTLSNIPKSLNGWSIECKFVGPGGVSFSNGATVRVNSANTTTNNNGTNNNSNTNTNANTNTSDTTKTATITTQPTGIETELGKTATLTIAASAGNGGKLSYQWYSSASNERANIISIPGATSSSYSPPQTEGTVYYCVSVISTLNGSQSTPVYSNLVPVRYTATTATPSPSPTADSSPSATPTASAAPTDNDSAGSDRYSFSTSLIFFGITGVVAIIAMVVIIIYIKKSGNDDDDEDEE